MPGPSPQPRIGFNAALLSFSDDYRAAGIHRYIAGMLPALARRDEFSIVAFTPDEAARAALPESIDVARITRLATRPVGRIIWEQTALPVHLHRSRSDLYHGAAYAMPVLPGALHGRPAVVTVHDLSFVRVRESFPRLQGWYLRAATRASVRRADALIAVSEFTRSELIEIYDVPPERVHTVYNGVDDAYHPASSDEMAAVRTRFDLPDDFLLAVGTLQPRKNLRTLFKAYALLTARRFSTPTLAVAGAVGWGDEQPEQLLASLGISRRVQLLGYVPEQHLPALYSAAMLLAMPSQYEGFGLPVLEAMACGTPVVVSDAESLGEVGGEATAVVGADEIGGWAAAIEALIDDDDRRRALAAAGLRRAQQFTWDRTAEGTAEVYRSVLSSNDMQTSEGSHDSESRDAT
jgi:glycosyltransferase involved in cell wall biosynthesis